jgi:hypothetical protein
MRRLRQQIGWPAKIAIWLCLLWLSPCSLIRERSKNPLDVQAATADKLAARLRGVFPKDGLERSHKKRRVRFREHQRRTQLNNVVMRAVRAG